MQTDHSASRAELALGFPARTALSANAEAIAALDRRLGQMREQAAAWIRTAADYYAAAAVYQQLSSLSDAELQRHALSRVSLARDVECLCRTHE